MNELQRGVTVFTPTYNREATLRRLYESIVEQACSSVEWLIVDDGSSDQTEALVRSFCREGKVDLRYIRKENGGKHTALNVGIREASREYFVCVDSDDMLCKAAISKILDCVQRDKPDGIIAYKAEYTTGKRIGEEFPEDLKQTTLLELINRHACRGDRTLIYKTELLRQITIPEPAGQRFFPETYLYDRFDEKYNSVLLREELCLCEYLAGGYSNTFRKLMIDNALSMKWFFAERIDLRTDFSVRYDAAYRYIAFSLLAGSRQGAYRGKNLWLLLIALPMGMAMFFVYLIHKLRMK